MEVIKSGQNLKHLKKEPRGFAELWERREKVKNVSKVADKMYLHLKKYGKLWDKFGGDKYKELSLRPVHWCLIDIQVKLQVIKWMYESDDQGRGPMCKYEFGNIQTTYVSKPWEWISPSRRLYITEKRKGLRIKLGVSPQIYRSGSWGESIRRNLRGSKLRK